MLVKPLIKLYLSVILIRVKEISTLICCLNSLSIHFACVFSLFAFFKAASFQSIWTKLRCGLVFFSFKKNESNSHCACAAPGCTFATLFVKNPTQVEN